MQSPRLSRKLTQLGNELPKHFGSWIKKIEILPLSLSYLQSSIFDLLLKINIKFKNNWRLFFYSLYPTNSVANHLNQWSFSFPPMYNPYLQNKMRSHFWWFLIVLITSAIQVEYENCSTAIKYIHILLQNDCLDFWFCGMVRNSQQFQFKK